MGKYTDAQNDIYSVFATPAWTGNGIETVPQNFKGTGLSEYVRVSIVAGGNFDYLNMPKSLVGQLIIDVFTAAGAGLKRAHEIADMLDAVLERKTVSTAGKVAVQFGASAMVPSGLDVANPSLHRCLYSIPFNYFGN